MPWKENLAPNTTTRKGVSDMDEFEKWLVELNELNKQEHRVVPKQYSDWTCAKYNTSSDILSKYRAFKAKAKEPLAIAISKAGYWHYKIYENSDGSWMIVIGTNTRNCLSTERRFEAPTYPAAEKAAREWLNKLEDRP